MGIREPNECSGPCVSCSWRWAQVAQGQVRRGHLGGLGSAAGELIFDSFTGLSLSHCGNGVGLLRARNRSRPTVYWEQGSERHCLCRSVRTV